MPHQSLDFENSKSKWTLSNKLSLYSIIISVFSFFITILVMCVTSQISNDIERQINSNPKLRVQRDDITFHWDKNGLPTSFNSDWIPDIDDNYLYTPSIHFENFGNDTALDIEVDWILFDNLNSINNKIGYKSEIKKLISENTVELSTVYGDNDSVYIVNDLKSSLSYIRPHTEEGLPIPLSLLDSITYYCFKYFPPSKDEIDYSRSFNDIEMPCIQIDVTYQNLLNKKVEDILNIKFRPISYEKNKDGSGYCCFEISSYFAQ